MIAYNFGAGAAGSPVPDWELLGRGVFSSRQAKMCRSNDGMPALVFHEADGVRTLSVDRLSVAPEEAAIENGERVAAARGEGRSFYGWALINAEPAASEECRAIVSPTWEVDGSNPYHADIVLPMSAVAVPGEQDKFALRLAARSRWVAR